MLFVLSDNFVNNLKGLREQYKQETASDLDKSSQPYAISCFFGAKDVITRGKQISFIEQWISVLDPIIHEDLAALRVLVAVCLYTKFKINEAYHVRTAILEQLIDNAMGKTGLNPLDEETRAICLLTTKRYLTTSIQHKSNSAMSFPFNEKQWYDFSRFINTECKLLDKKFKNNYPLTTLMMPLCATPMALAGYAGGYLLGDLVGKSTKLLPARYALTAMVGSTLIMFTGPHASLGIMIFAPTCAGRILDTFCGVSLAWIMGASMNLIGKSMGLGIGMTLDMTWKLIYKACGLITELYKGDAYQKLTGLSLIDGHRVLEGIDLQLIDLDNLPKEYAPCPIEFKVEDNHLIASINNEEATFALDQDHLPYVSELKQLLRSHAQNELALNCSTKDETEAPAAASSLS